MRRARSPAPPNSTITSACGVSAIGRFLSGKGGAPIARNSRATSRPRAALFSLDLESGDQARPLRVVCATGRASFMTLDDIITTLPAPKPLRLGDVALF